MAAAEEEVKTLFVSGLPDDIKEREIHNLFRSYDGYETCQLKYSGRGFQVSLISEKKGVRHTRRMVLCRHFVRVCNTKEEAKKKKKKKQQPLCMYTELFDSGTSCGRL
jgi:hypothetical protein